MDISQLINDRISQKATSIKITRQAETNRQAIQAESEKWAEKLGVYEKYRDDVFLLIDQEAVEIKDTGEITGVKEQVQRTIERIPGLAQAPAEKKDQPPQIGGGLRA